MNKTINAAVNKSSKTEQSYNEANSLLYAYKKQ